jgi:streptomycin 6-kinase
VTLDVPDAVRNKVLSEGQADWLEDLPSTVATLAEKWSLTVGRALRGGHAALVLEVRMVDGTAAVLKIGVPGTQRDIAFEAVVLRLADGDGCVRLLRDDLDHNALLLERLGAPMYDVVPDATTRHDLLCDVAIRMWRPLAADVDLPTGADLARRSAALLPQLWEETGQPCSWRTVEDAITCAEHRRRAHDDRRAVLVHGDVHDANALEAGDGAFKLIDPGGFRAEPACDLGTIVRCNPDTGDDLRARTARLAARTDIDATAIWQWGTIHRVVGGLYSRRVGFQPFGDLLLAEADRLTG